MCDPHGCLRGKARLGKLELGRPHLPHCWWPSGLPGQVSGNSELLPSASILVAHKNEQVLPQPLQGT